MSNVVCILGPTAAGKTALACAAFDQFPIDLISVDSVLIYRDMNIGSGKPTREELKRYPHQLIDICDPSEIYSAYDFVHAAKSLIEQSHNNKRLPLLVGGTMMYFHVLQQAYFADVNVKFANIICCPERAKLHEVINQRFLKMLDLGLVAEVEKLYQRGDLHLNLPSIRSVGYRQVWEYLSGKYSYDEMIFKAQAATRQLAKRQYTWMNKWPNENRIDSFARDAQKTVYQIINNAII